jgi:ATP-dependent helicase HrpA
MKSNLIDQIRRLLPEAMAVDRHAVLQGLKRIETGPRRSRRKAPPHPEALLQRLRKSIETKQRRLARCPAVGFDPALPITAQKDAIIRAVQEHPVVIVSGETGSGKSTQLPKFCLAAGRGADGKIGCTEPRRIAATSIAARIADELGETPGQTVGYKIRFSDRTSGDTLIKIMTDGILLAEAQKDRYLTDYDTIIVDEAHERSLNIDFVLGLLRTLLEKRDDLKVIVTSATIDTEKFSEAFDNAPVIDVSGRRYAVDVVYYPDTAEHGPSETDGSDEATCVEQAVEAVRQLTRRGRPGDILVFMPTEQDIRETCEILEGGAPPGTFIFPLFARLSAADQARVFARRTGRKIIVATNVAETSLTIPGVRYVVDTGLARVAQYNPRSRTTALPVVPVSRSSADQRKGRCGRMEHGVAIRLFSEADYAARPLYTPPEILRSSLAEVILRMLALRLGDIHRFPFIDRPAAKSVKDGYALLTELGAITAAAQGVRRKVKGKRPETRGTGFAVQASGPKETDPSIGASQTAQAASVRTDDRRGADAGSGGNESQPKYRLTARGKLMARLPVDPRIARMLIEARQEGCLAEVTVIAAALSIQDPRERPSENAGAADRVHAEFFDRTSDFLTLLKIWNRYQETRRQLKRKKQVRKYCRDHFLSYRRMREWQDIHAQLCEILTENRMRPPAEMPELSTSRCGAVHRCILSGFLSNIAEKKEKNLFRAARGREVMVFPGSALFNRAGGWIVAAEMVQTSRLFARTVADIDVGWLEPLGGELCRSAYLNPRWNVRRGEVTATEQVSLFGLVIVSGRTVSYGKVDAEEATEIFIRRALMDGELRNPPSFLTHNRRCLDEVRDIENRIRRRDLLVGADTVYRFYRDRLGPIFSQQALRRLIRSGDAFLRFKKEDLMLYEPGPSVFEQYPDQVRLGRRKFACTYRFEPGEPDDGVTVTIPLSQAGDVPEDALDWLVPGLLKEKITALIKGLPKRYRRHLVPVAQSVDHLSETVGARTGPLINCLSEAIHRQYGLSIPAAAWPVDTLPEHLIMRVSIIGPTGEEIHSGRGRSALRHPFPEVGRPDALARIKRQWEKKRITRWEFGELPERIEIELEKHVPGVLFPALSVDPRDCRRIDLKLFQRPDAALASHKQGVAALYAIYFSRELKHLQKSLALPQRVKPAARHFGGVDRIEFQIITAMVHSLFRENIRSAEVFYETARSRATQMAPVARELRERAVEILEAYGAARTVIDQLARTVSPSSPLKTLFDDLRTELARLVPDNFIQLYSTDRLDHLPRYIRAAAIRARRAEDHLEKDQVKARSVHPFNQALQEVLAQLGPESSESKRAATEEFFWLIEEFKVSLFAQELKTAVPVSQKRLNQRLAEIERMV